MQRSSPYRSRPIDDPRPVRPAPATAPRPYNRPPSRSQSFRFVLVRIFTLPGIGTEFSCPGGSTAARKPRGPGKHRAIRHAAVLFGETRAWSCPFSGPGGTPPTGHSNDSAKLKTASPSCPPCAPLTTSPNSGAVDDFHVAPPSRVCSSSVSVGTSLRRSRRAPAPSRTAGADRPARGGVEPPTMMPVLAVERDLRCRRRAPGLAAGLAASSTGFQVLPPSWFQAPSSASPRRSRACRRETTRASANRQAAFGPSF